MKLTAWVKSVNDYIRSFAMVDSDTIIWTKTLAGWVGNVVVAKVENKTEGDGGGGTSVYPAQVKSKDGVNHICNIHANGKDADATEESVPVNILQLNVMETLPVDSWIMVSESQLGITGGGDVP